MQQRIGIGYDIHRTQAGRRLLLGGVEIPHERGLIGHSDADVVLHAICDALLGAAGLGDIGELFPDTDPAYKDVDSRELLRNVVARIQAAGLEVGNVDLIVHAEAPKLGPHKARIRASVAELLDLPESAVGVKATTNESMGEIGRGEAIACWAAVLLHAVEPAD
jgi:2-C-methyl-D-erythritol 2,4-cyclodiphosphate synthase